MQSKLADQHIQARNFTNTDGRRVDLIVMHTDEANERPDNAENVARFIDVNLNLSLDLGPEMDRQWDPLIFTTGDQEQLHVAEDLRRVVHTA